MAPQKFTLQQRIYLVECYIINRNCGKVRQCFARQFPHAPIPSRIAILNLVKKFRETGSVLNKCGKRNPSVLTEAKLDKIGERLEHSPRKSLRSLAQEMGVSKTTAFRATKLLKFKPYKVTIVQELQPTDNIEQLQLDSMIMAEEKQEDDSISSATNTSPADMDSVERVNCEELDLDISNRLTNMIEGQFYAGGNDEEEEEEEEDDDDVEKILNEGDFILSL